jgi:hypothetical protein
MSRIFLKRFCIEIERLKTVARRDFIGCLDGLGEAKRSKNHKNIPFGIFREGSVDAPIETMPRLNAIRRGVTNSANAKQEQGQVRRSKRDPRPGGPAALSRKALLRIAQLQGEFHIWKKCAIAISTAREVMFRVAAPEKFSCERKDRLRREIRQ